MICRIWHGWTSPSNADAYESLLKSEIFRGIQEQRIAGFKGIDLLRLEPGSETEFVTMMWFDSLEAVVARSKEKGETQVFVDGRFRSKPSLCA